jgi:histidinol dehydrogenase
MSPIKTIKWSDLADDQRTAALRRPTVSLDSQTRQLAAEIVAAVRAGGDTVLHELTLKLDQVALDRLRVSDKEFDVAAAALSPAALAAIDTAIENVKCFHEAQRPGSIDLETMPGIRCERVCQPIDAVGLYVPAGSAPLPSAAIMLAVPASIASCPIRIMCTPPQKNGFADPAVITAARRSGVDTVFKVGGAQAIAAMAYGTETVPKVNRIFGPGNAWVTAAKSIVAGDIEGAAIDMPAGPSEVLVIADENADAAFVASDLISQAEHGADSQAILLTTSNRLAEEVAREITSQLDVLPRAAIASRALQNSHIFLVEDLQTAVTISNRYAPEHLILQVAEPRSWLSQVRNAGSVFLGSWSPESAGDYCSGTNHVLPTYGFARSYSGLGVDQFMRYMSVQELSAQGLRSIAPAIIELANLEGLDAHAAAVKIRLAHSASTERP